MAHLIKPWHIIVTCLIEGLFIYHTYSSYPGEFVSNFQAWTWWLSEPSIIIPTWLISGFLIVLSLKLSNLAPSERASYTPIIHMITLFAAIAFLSPIFSMVAYTAAYEQAAVFSNSFLGWFSLLGMLAITIFGFLGTMYHSFDIYDALFGYASILDRFFYLGAFMFGGFLFPLMFFSFVQFSNPTALASFFLIITSAMIVSANINAKKALEARDYQRMLEKLQNQKPWLD